MSDSELCVVYSAGSLEEAYFIRSLLHDEGIDARVVGDNLQYAVSDIPIFQAIQILVEKTDLQKAQKVTTEYDTRQAERNR